MKTFKEYVDLKEDYHMGRPHGPMGPDGKIYGWSGGPASQVPGTGTRGSGRQLTPPPIPVYQPKLKPEDMEKHLEQIWQDSTSEFKRKALDIGEEEIVPRSFGSLSPEQKFKVRKVLGY